MFKELKIIENLRKLKLNSMEEQIIKLIDDGSNRDFIDKLDKMIENELIYKKKRGSQIMIKISNLPTLKTLEDFDFDFQKSISKSKILRLATLNFLEDATNILFIGNPGVGKTHLAAAIAQVSACNKNSTYFIHCHKLIEILKRSIIENKLDNTIKKFCRYKLLVIDEIGYIPFDNDGSKALFQLLNLRHIKKSTIITTNVPLSNWNKIFKDPMLGLAILDRLVERSEIVEIDGISYRTRNIMNQE